MSQVPFIPRRRRLLARSTLWQRHPVLTPLAFLAGSVLLGVISMFTDSLFPLLVFIGVPLPLLCLLIAFILGVAGVLTGIIGIIEFLDRACLKATGSDVSGARGA